jgi:hypothetical protein
MQLLCSLLCQVAALFTLFLLFVVRLLLLFSPPNAFSVPFSVLLLELVLQVAAVLVAGANLQFTRDHSSSAGSERLVLINRWASGLSI